MRDLLFAQQLVGAEGWHDRARITGARIPDLLERIRRIHPPCAVRAQIGADVAGQDTVPVEHVAVQATTLAVALGEAFADSGVPGRGGRSPHLHGARAALVVVSDGREMLRLLDDRSAVMVVRL